MTVVGSATSGADVMTLVKQHRPDVALLDINMPGVDGLTCLEMIKRHDPAITVIMLSAFDDKEHVEAALTRGASAYVVKSVDPADLAAIVRSASSGVLFSAYSSTPKPRGE